MQNRSIEKTVWWTALAVLFLAAVVMLGAWN
jgi:ABC-type transporter Mla subunit MlaD